MWNCIYFDKLPTSISNYSLTHINNTLMICLGNTKTKVFYRCSLLRAGFFMDLYFDAINGIWRILKCARKKPREHECWLCSRQTSLIFYFFNVLTIEIEVARDESYFVCTQSLVTRVRDFHVHTYQPYCYIACFCWRTRIRTTYFQGQPESNTKWTLKLQSG